MVSRAGVYDSWSATVGREDCVINSCFVLSNRASLAAAITIYFSSPRTPHDNGGAAAQLYIFYYSRPAVSAKSIFFSRSWRLAVFCLARYFLSGLQSVRTYYYFIPLLLLYLVSFFFYVSPTSSFVAVSP